MTKKKRVTKEDLLKVERSAVREERKEQGALDGRFRERVVPDKRRKARRKRKVDPDEE